MSTIAVSAQRAGMPNPYRPEIKAVDIGELIESRAIDKSAAAEARQAGSTGVLNMPVSILNGIGEDGAKELKTNHNITTVGEFANHQGPFKGLTGSQAKSAENLRAALQSAEIPTPPPTMPAFPAIDAGHAIKSGILDQGIAEQLTGKDGANKTLAEMPLTAIKGIGETTAREIGDATGIRTVGALAAFEGTLPAKTVDQLSTRDRERVTFARANLREPTDTPQPPLKQFDAAAFIKAGLIDKSEIPRFTGKNPEEIRTAEMKALKGIGPETQAYLREAGVRTVEQFSRADLPNLFSFNDRTPGGEFGQDRLKNLQAAVNAVLTRPGTEPHPAGDFAAAAQRTATGLLHMSEGDFPYIGRVLRIEGEPTPDSVRKAASLPEGTPVRVDNKPSYFADWAAYYRDPQSGAGSNAEKMAQTADKLHKLFGNGEKPVYVINVGDDSSKTPIDRIMVMQPQGNRLGGLTSKLTIT